MQSAVFLLNSRSHLFTAAPSRSPRGRSTLQGRTFSRSYGTSLPSSFSRVLPSALEYSSRPPVSVCGTVASGLKLRGFSWDSFQQLRNPWVPRPRPLDHDAGFAWHPPSDGQPGLPTPGLPSAIRPPVASSGGAGILTRFPSATHLCLALGADSPCPDERWTGNLGLSAWGPFTPIIATHVSIRTSDTSSTPYGAPSQAYGTLSYHTISGIRSFGGRLSPVTSSAQDDSISELLRFL